MDSTFPLLLSAGGLALLHTVIGVDHYLPFVVLGRARGWRLRRVAGVAAACGMGHVLASVALGGVGVGLGMGASSLGALQDARGALAAWLLIGFGLTYAAWAAARQRRQARRLHHHAEGVLHAHAGAETPHDHRGERAPVPHGTWTDSSRLTISGLLVIFLVGPCEPLIPLLMGAALAGGWPAAASAGAVFSSVTILAMVLLACLGHAGASLPRFSRLEPHAQTLAGLSLALVGGMTRLLGI